MNRKTQPGSVPALKVRQWLSDWNEVRWSKSDRGAEPQHWFYQFSMGAGELKALSGIYPRSTRRQRGTDDLGIQRGRDVDRSEEIRRFVKYGYPWSELSKAKRESGEFADLRQPGWLPTAIVVNVLTENDERVGKKVDKSDLVEIEDLERGQAKVILPKNFTRSNWKCKSIPPIEVIDGQHRLWAFENSDPSGDFELPVVAFVGLDLRWQAYLFYTINIKPKKINASLAFDLYPLLRTQEWLTKFEGHVIYRESRAQELVDLLWSFKDSPWYRRINMLGEKGYKGIMVTQAAWVRSLLSSFVKSWEGPGVRIGGLFGSAVGEHETVLPWSRTDQAAFLIVAGQILKDAIGKTSDPWAEALRAQSRPSQLDEADDMAFYGPNSLLNQDQGIRTFLQIFNDLIYVRADELELGSWEGAQGREGSDDQKIKTAVAALKRKTKVINYLKQIAEVLASIDWRSSDARGLSLEERTLKASFRGGGGYKELRAYVLNHFARAKGNAKNAAQEVISILGY